jgi:hypothetical protein
VIQVVSSIEIPIPGASEALEEDDRDGLAGNDSRAA